MAEPRARAGDEAEAEAAPAVATADFRSMIDARASRIPRSEAIALMAFATGRTREQVVAESGTSPPRAAIAWFDRLVARRAAGEPIAFLTGRREFFGRSFAVDRSVLIPRHETELLVELASQRIRQNGKEPDRGRVHALELGTGSGAIAITLALECPELQVIATDLSSAALTVARSNAQRLAADVRFVEGDWFAALIGEETEPFALIVANPPYLAADDPHLDLGDLRFEPKSALTDGADGLAAIRRIVADAPRFLAPGGCLLLEHGAGQAAAVRALLDSAAFGSVASFRDLAGIERVTCGTWQAGIVATGVL